MSRYRMSRIWNQREDFMFEHNLSSITSTLSELTGLEVEARDPEKKGRSNIELWLAQLQRRNGPYIELSAAGLKRHIVNVRFGQFASSTISQMGKTEGEALILARALIESACRNYVYLPETIDFNDVRISDKSFELQIERHGIENYLSEKEILHTCREIVSPLLSAFAELIGYDQEEEPLESPGEEIWEGEIRQTTMLKRERSRRNRLLCFKIHGEKCAICGFSTDNYYQGVPSILEVHHIVPLSSQNEPRPYDPATDLIPLCPNCHRAIHAGSSTPTSPDALRELLKNE